jgi:magnesium transporter
VVKTLLYESGVVREGKPEKIEKPGVIGWVDFENPSEEEFALASRLSKLDVQELKDNLERTQGAVTKNYEEYSLLVFRSALRGEREAYTQPFVILVSKKQKDFITLHRYPSTSMERIRNYGPQRLASIFAKGPTMLLYILLDEFIESYRTALAAVEDVVEEVEEAVITGTSRDVVLKQVLAIKKALVFYRKDLAANREVVSSIEKEYAENLDRGLLSKFRLHYADLAALYDSVSIYHDVLSTAIEVHLSIVSNNLNLTMKKMTSWGAIILVPSLIAGIYGMNFAHLPLSESTTGFWVLLGIMAASVFGLVRYFKKRDWI